MKRFAFIAVFFFSLSLQASFYSSVLLGKTQKTMVMKSSNLHANFDGANQIGAKVGYGFLPHLSAGVSGTHSRATGTFSENIPNGVEASGSYGAFRVLADVTAYLKPGRTGSLWGSVFFGHEEGQFDLVGESQVARGGGSVFGLASGYDIHIGGSFYLAPQITWFTARFRNLVVDEASLNLQATFWL